MKDERTQESGAEKGGKKSKNKKQKIHTKTGLEKAELIKQIKCF